MPTRKKKHVSRAITNRDKEIEKLRNQLGMVLEENRVLNENLDKAQIDSRELDDVATHLARAFYQHCRQHGERPIKEGAGFIEAEGGSIQITVRALAAFTYAAARKANIVV